MADTAVAITAGTGTNIDTRTEGTNGNHRQVIVVGDPNTNAGVAPVDATNGLSVNVTNASLTVASHAVTDGGGSLTVDNGGTFAVQVTSAPSTAVTNAGTFAVQDSRYVTEDAAAAADPIGPMTMAVRRGTLSASEVSADGDIIAVKATSKGKLHAAAEVYLGDSPAATGSGAMGTTTQRVALATDSPGVLATTTPGTLGSSGASMTVVNPSVYETVAASQTNQVLGPTGATGDFINGVLVIPATTSPGNVLLLDNATSITIFTGGASSVSNLVPFFIPLGMTSVSGSWRLTTGANVSAIGIGKFT